MFHEIDIRLQICTNTLWSWNIFVLQIWPENLSPYQCQEELSPSNNTCVHRKHKKDTPIHLWVSFLGFPAPAWFDKYHCLWVHSFFIHSIQPNQSLHFQFNLIVINKSNLEQPTLLRRAKGNFSLKAILIITVREKQHRKYIESR